jgi:hypothetical protein
MVFDDPPATLRNKRKQYSDSPPPPKRIRPSGYWPFITVICVSALSQLSFA